MWRPLCIAALNTPPERASAQVFLAVLRDSLGARRAASDMLLPRTNLTKLFPQHAAAYIERRGGRVFSATPVKSIGHMQNQWVLDVGDGATCFEGVIVATHPAQAANLLSGLTDTRLLQELDYEPITTCYLQYTENVRLDAPFYALLDDAETGMWGQFVFDRGQLDVGHRGLLAIVVSAAADAVTLPQDALAAAVATQLAQVFRRPELRRPAWTKVISEKRATFSCTPALKRPVNDIGVPGIMLAGDYTASNYPATLESAVRSGIQAADCLARTL
jgi:squalene-associated FAD-dependent desaturase